MAENTIFGTQQAVWKERLLGKSVKKKNCECVPAALGIRHAIRIRRNIMLSVACRAVLNFPTLSHKRYDFREKVTEHKMCGLIVCNISHSKQHSATYCHKYKRSSYKVPLLSQIYTVFM